MQNNKRMWVWVGVVVVLFGVVAFIIWPHSNPSQTATGPVPVYAAKGQITPQFPKSLILDGLSSVNSSYSINYASSTNQYTAIFDTSTSIDVLFKSYRQYFLANGWQIQNAVTSLPTSRSLYAVTSSSEANVSITQAQQGSGSRVTISYLAK